MAPIKIMGLRNWLSLRKWDEIDKYCMYVNSILQKSKTKNLRKYKLRF